MASIFYSAKKIVNYLRDVDNVFRTVKLIFHHIGLWPRLERSSIFPAKPLIQTWCPRFLLAVSVYFTLVSSPIASYVRRDDHIVQFLEPLAFAFMSSMIFIHVASLLFRGERYERVFRTLYEMRVCAARYSVRPKVIKKRAKLYTDLVLAYILQIACAGTGIVLICFPVLMYSRKFLFGSWYPYNAKRSPFYELTTLVWIVYLPLGAAIMSTMNALLMYLFAQAIAHTRLLRFTLENIKPLSVLAVDRRMAANGLNAKRDDQTEHELLVATQLWGGSGGGSFRRGYFIDMLLKKEMEKNIRLCVRHHQIINRFVGDLGSAFGLILVHQLNCCLFPTAMSIVLVLFAPEVNIKIFLFVFMTFIVFVNLFLFCWLAQEVVTETSLVGDSVFACDWLEASNSFKRSMLVMMTRCNQPLVVTVAGFIPLNVSLCIKMIKMTYSYYMSAVETLDMKRSLATSED